MWMLVERPAWLLRANESAFRFYDLPLHFHGREASKSGKEAVVNLLAVIPARYASQRFPAKPLAMIGERPMVEWVYRATVGCEVFQQVVVATEDERIADAVKKFGGTVEMTRSDHATGTDRVAEVAARYPDAQVVANVQGDQPFVTAEMLRRLVAPYLAGETPEMTTLACEINDPEIETDPNSVKVVCSRSMHALYFSRSPIPYYRERHDAPVYHHLGLYAFRRDFLQTYTTFAATPLEQCEQLEQLRVLENDGRIRVSLAEKHVLEINTPEDLARAHAFVVPPLGG